jgi:hypothetical protein
MCPSSRIRNGVFLHQRRNDRGHDRLTPGGLGQFGLRPMTSPQPKGARASSGSACRIGRRIFGRRRYAPPIPARPIKPGSWICRGSMLPPPANMRQRRRNSSPGLRDTATPRLSPMSFGVVGSHVRRLLISNGRLMRRIMHLTANATSRSLRPGSNHMAAV